MARQLNARQLARLWVRAGGAPSKARTAAAIALAESGGRVDALNPRAPDYSVGPWQINYFGNLREPRTRQFGSPQQLMSDPLANARAAVAISQGGRDFTPWSTYTSGAYRSRVPRSTAPLGGIPNLPKSPKSPKSSGSPFPNLTSIVLQNLGSDYSPSFQLSNLVSAVMAMPSSSTPRPGLPASVSPVRDVAGRTGVVQAVKQEIGIPYSWGGGGPGGPSLGFGRGAKTKGFDCSSLLQYGWAKAGVNIPRTTYSQWKAGKTVRDPRPGDAVFFNMGKSGPEHVGIYIGNGKFIEAPHTGAQIRVSDLSGRSDYVGARTFG